MPFILHEILIYATPLTGHLQSKDGHGVLILTSGSLIRRVLYYSVNVFRTLLNKINFITYNTLKKFKLEIFLNLTIPYNV